MRSRYDQALDYFPLLAYLGFWVQGALIPSIMTGEVKLMLLGFVTTPALVCLALAALRIRRNHGEERGE